MRRKLALTVVILAVLSGAGCSLFTAPDRASLAIRRETDVLLIAVCGDIEATHLLMEERNLSEDRDWETFWERTVFEVEFGDVLSTAPDGFPGEGDILKVNPTMGAGDGIRITITQSGPEGGTIAAQAQFYVPDSGLTQTDWQQEDGTRTSDPCARP